MLKFLIRIWPTLAIAAAYVAARLSGLISRDDTLLYFIVVLGLLIFVHELGHFIVAKRAGICVEAFSLGFGPRLVGIRRGGTDYRISALPLGGYVKMRGEDAAAGATTDPASFAAKGVWTRAKVILFGPLMNLILCLVLMPAVYMIGRSEPVYLREKPVIMGVRAGSPADEAGLAEGDLIVSVDGKAAASWENVLERVMLSPGQEMGIAVERGSSRIERKLSVGEMQDVRGGYAGFEPMLFLGNEAVVDAVAAGSPADKAGMMAGDKVLSFGGNAVADWMDLSARVDHNGGAPARIVVERGGERLDLIVTPAHSESEKRWLIGISKDLRRSVPMTVVRYGLLDSIAMGMKENLRLAGLTLDVLGKLITMKLSFKVLGGPIMIAKGSAAAAAMGASHFIYFLAFLSLQLAVLNFLPIPVLDGGHLVYLAIEAIRRRPVSARVRAAADHVGLALLITLMALVTYNDLQRWIERVLH